MKPFLAAISLALLLAPAGARAGAPPAPGPPLATPADSVRSFYAFHFAHDMGFSAAAVDARAAWLTPDLLGRCRKYFTRNFSPDEVPPIDGDPFTDSQEYPERFEVGKVRLSGGTATVQVKFSGPGANAGSLKVLLTAADGSWRIDDVRYSSGPSFRALLSR